MSLWFQNEAEQEVDEALQLRVQEDHVGQEVLAEPQGVEDVEEAPKRIHSSLIVS